MSESPTKSVELLALEEAVSCCADHTGTGGQSELARRIGKTQGYISTWLRRGRCAADAVLAIEKATGVSRHRLRPDVFGAAPVPVSAAAAAQVEAAE